MDSEVKSSEYKNKYHKLPVNNPFIRDKYIWHRDNAFYDKIKVSNEWMTSKLQRKSRLTHIDSSIAMPMI